MYHQKKIINWDRTTIHKAQDGRNVSGVTSYQWTIWVSECRPPEEKPKSHCGSRLASRKEGVGGPAVDYLCDCKYRRVGSGLNSASVCRLKGDFRRRLECGQASSVRATSTTFCKDSDVAAAAQGVDISDLGTDSCGFRYHLVNRDSQVIILCVRTYKAKTDLCWNLIK